MSRPARTCWPLVVTGVLAVSHLAAAQGVTAEPTHVGKRPAPQAVEPGFATLLGGPDTDTAAAVALRPDGGMYVAGRTQNGAVGLVGVWVARLSHMGTPLWQRGLGGQFVEEAAALVATDDGGCLVAGWTYSFSAGGSDGLLIKLDAAGDVEWQRSYGGRGDDRFLSIAAAPGGFYLGGAYWDAATGTDAWVLKVDAVGDVEWQQRLAGEQEDGITSVDTTPDGGVVFCANSNSSFGGLDGAAVPSIPFFRPWVVRLDAAGAVVWQKTYNYSGGDAFTRIVALDDGGYVATGEILAMAFFRGDVWTVRLDAQGDVLWDRRLGDHFDVYFVDSGVSVEPTADGGFAVLAYTGTAGLGSQSLYYIRLDGAGQLLWDTTLGGPGFDRASAMTLTPAGSAVLVGQMQLGPAGDTQSLVVRMRPDGQTGVGCGLAGATDANSWTDTVDVGAVTVLPVPTSVQPSHWPAAQSVVVGSQLICPAF
jgi:hypothetical protein